jgi:hypothetical protein
VWSAAMSKLQPRHLLVLLLAPRPLPSLVVALLGGEAIRIIRDCLVQEPLVDLQPVANCWRRCGLVWSAPMSKLQPGHSLVLLLAPRPLPSLVVAWLGAEAIRIIRDCLVVVDPWVVLAVLMP